MTKLLLTTAAVAVFMFNSPAMASSDNAELQDLDKMSTAERALNDKSAQSILNEMDCADKESGDKIKDSTDGTTHTCP